MSFSSCSGSSSGSLQSAIQAYQQALTTQGQQKAATVANAAAAATPPSGANHPIPGAVSGSTINLTA